MRSQMSLVLCAACLVLASGCSTSSTEDSPDLNPAKPLRDAFAVSLQVAALQITQRQNVTGELPQGDGLQVLIAAGIKGIPDKDPWDGEVRYHGEGQHFTLKSPGPDGKWGTRDDITIADGQVERLGRE